MWFSRKQRNRRLGRGRVLDVKLRSAQVRTSRLHLGVLTFNVLFGTMLKLYLL